MDVRNTPQALLTRIARSSIKDQALEQLKGYILAEGLAPGQRLPSERELAEQLGVGRNSVREALRVLEAVGLVESRIGEGTFIIANTGASIGRTVGLGLAAWGGAIMEIMGARQIIEVESAYVAAERADANDLSALNDTLRRMETTDDVQVYLAADMEFHRCLGRATHNGVIANITKHLMDFLQEVLAETHGDQLMTTAEGVGTHRSVYQAVARRDGPAAAAAMRTHLRFSAELWQTIISLTPAPARKGTQATEPSVGNSTAEV